MGRTWLVLGCVLALVSSLGCAARSPALRVERTVARATPDHSWPGGALPTSQGQITVGVDHVVQPGQTLWRIAKAYGVELQVLARANEIDDPARLEVGRVLFVPGALVVRDVPAYPAPPVATAPEGRVSEARFDTEESDWLWPVLGGQVLSGFGTRRSAHTHKGVDIRGRRGQSVVAARDGRVRYSGSTMRGYGKTVIVDHGDGLSSLYAHNSELLVKAGQVVERGQSLARIGRSGNATTDHCHFEIRRHDRPIDPLMLLRPRLEARR